MHIRDIFKLNNDCKNLSLITYKEGLDNKIRDVKLLINKEDIYWFEENDLIFIVDSYLENQDELFKLIDLVKKKRCAALCIQLDKEHKFINELTIYANSKNVCIINIPKQININMIIWDVKEYLDSNVEYDELQLKLFRKEILKLKEHCDVKRIIKILDKYTNKNIYLLTNYNSNFTVNNSDTIDKLIRIKSILTNNINEDKLSKEPLTYELSGDKYTIFTLKAENKVLGFLFLRSTKGESINLKEYIMINEVLPLILLRLLIKKNSIDLKYSSRRDLIMSIINGDKIKSNNYKKLIEFYNLPSDDNDKIFIIIELDEVDNCILNEKLCLVKEYIEDNIYDSIAIINEDKVLFIHNFYEYKNSNIFKEIINDVYIKSKYYCNKKIRIGVSKKFKILKEANKFYEQALLALKFGPKSLRKTNIYYYDDLLIYDLLIQISNNQIIWDIYKMTIYKIENYDFNNNTELVETIGVFLEKNYSIIDTSKELCVHRNTLSKHLDKIESIINMDLSSSHTRLLLQLGLIFHDIIRLLNIDEKNKII